MPEQSSLSGETLAKLVCPKCGNILGTITETGIRIGTVEIRERTTLHCHCGKQRSFRVKDTKKTV
jgi:RNase P subunit RPR2